MNLRWKCKDYKTCNQRLECRHAIPHHHGLNCNSKGGCPGCRMFSQEQIDAEEVEGYIETKGW